VSQFVLVDEVLIAERDAEDTLTNQGCKFVLDQIGVAGILEAGRKALDQANGAICGAEVIR
jgi:hypothetical protein